MPSLVILTASRIASTSHTVLMAEKDGEEVQETLYILPPDMLAERWTGKRFTPEEARARSGAAQIASSGEWENRLKLLMRSGRFERIAMDLYRHDPEDADTESIRMARRLRKWYPAATLTDISRQIRRQRTIKQPRDTSLKRWSYWAPTSLRIISPSFACPVYS